MEKEINQKQNEEISVIKNEVVMIKNDIGWIKGKLDKIEKQVFNELPHKIDEIKDKIFYGFLVMIVAAVVVQIILKLF